MSVVATHKIEEDILKLKEIILQLESADGLIFFYQKIHEAIQSLKFLSLRIRSVNDKYGRCFPDHLFLTILSFLRASSVYAVCKSWLKVLKKNKSVKQLLSIPRTLISWDLDHSWQVKFVDIGTGYGVYQNEIFLSYRNHLTVFDAEGTLLRNIIEPYTRGIVKIAVNENESYLYLLLCDNSMIVMSPNGQLCRKFKVKQTSTHSMAVSHDVLVIAEERTLYVYSIHGELRKTIPVPISESFDNDYDQCTRVCIYKKEIYVTGGGSLLVFSLDGQRRSILQNPITAYASVPSFVYSDIIFLLNERFFWLYDLQGKYLGKLSLHELKKPSFLVDIRIHSDFLYILIETSMDIFKLEFK